MFEIYRQSWSLLYWWWDAFLRIYFETSLMFVDHASPVNLNSYSIHTDRQSRREHVIIQDTSVIKRPGSSFKQINFQQIKLTAFFYHLSSFNAQYRSKLAVKAIPCLERTWKTSLKKYFLNNGVTLRKHEHKKSCNQYLQNTHIHLIEKM